jgi:hypothetical protein
MAGVVLIDGVERRRRSRPKTLHFGSYHLRPGDIGKPVGNISVREFDDLVSQRP